MKRSKALILDIFARGRCDRLSERSLSLRSTSGLSNTLAFTYTVMNPGETECLGCIYITPLAQWLERAAAIVKENPDINLALPPSAEVNASDAVVTFWIRQSRLADDLDQRLLQKLTNWFQTAWSFSRVTFLAKKAQQRQISLFEQLGMTLLYTLPNAKIYLGGAAKA